MRESLFSLFRLKKIRLFCQGVSVVFIFPLDLTFRRSLPFPRTEKTVRSMRPNTTLILLSVKLFNALWESRTCAQQKGTVEVRDEPWPK